MFLIVVHNYDFVAITKNVMKDDELECALMYYQ